jgi:outer membrane protein assembly factor BamE (lipoprotein component of BamABCDE complex)
MRGWHFALALVLAGCAGTGTKVSEEQAQSFQVGRSTYNDVVAALGQPTTVTTSTGGGRVASYTYAAVSAQPQNFIPYIGPLVSGYDTKSNAVTFTFDGAGILRNTTSTQGNSSVGTGLVTPR